MERGLNKKRKPKNKIGNMIGVGGGSDSSFVDSVAQKEDRPEKGGEDEDEDRIKNFCTIVRKL